MTVDCLPVYYEFMSSAAEMEPSPFDDEFLSSTEASATPRRRPTDPVLPLSTEELDRITKIAPHMRVLDPWRCAFNLASTDGSVGGLPYGRGGPVHQCRTRIADPTKARYCITHAGELGVAFYSPEEATAMVVAESTANLTRLIPKAIVTMETVMDDTEAPAGIRAKTAADVLDRTGFHKGVDIHMDATVTVDDPTSKLREKLAILRDAQMEHAQRLMDEAQAHEDAVVEAEWTETVPEAIEAPEGP